MRLAELRPCDSCGAPTNPVFHVVRASIAIVNQDAVRRHVGMATFLGAPIGSPVASNFDGSGHDAIVLAAEAKDPETGKREIPWVEIFLCTSCYAACLGVPVSNREARLEREKEATPCRD